MLSPFFIYNDNHWEVDLNQVTVVLCFNPADLWRSSCDPRSHDPINNQGLQLSTVVQLLLVQTLFYLLVIRPFSKHKLAIVFPGQVKQIHLHPVFSVFQEH